MRLLFVIPLFSFFIFCSCKNFQQVQLQQTDPVNHKLALGTFPSSNALLLNQDGSIDNFEGGSHQWTNDFYTIQAYVLNGNLILKADSAVGEAYIYRKFNPIRFDEANYLEVKSEFEGERPPFFITFKDLNQEEVLIQPEKIMEGSVYYTLPSENLNFNLNQVCEIRIYIGSPKNIFTGSIYIDYIKAVK